MHNGNKHKYELIHLKDYIINRCSLW